MFLKSKKLRKLMKDACRTTGLVVGRISADPGNEEIAGDYYIAGPFWEVWFKNGYIPKEIKAQIVELASDIPEFGDQYRITKKEAQMEIVDSLYYANYPGFSGLTDKYEKTHLDYDNMKVFQNNMGKIKLLNAVIEDVIDITEIDPDMEKIPIGPLSDAKNRNLGLLWKNDVCAFLMLPAIDEKSEKLEENDWRIKNN